MRLPLSVLLAGALGLGCHSIIDPTFETMAYGVRVTATPDPTQFAGVGYDVTILNTGSATVFLDWCGDQPQLVVDEWIDGSWSRHPTPDCVAASPVGPLPLAGETARHKATSFATTGRFRVGIRVSQSSDFANPREALSASFDIR